jgi:hypothetical protein
MKLIALISFVILTIAACGKSDKETKAEKCKNEAQEYSALPSVPNGGHDKLYGELLASCLSR